MINCGGYSHGGDLPSSVNAPIFSSHDVVLKRVAGNVERKEIPEIVIASGPIQMKMVFESQSTDLDVSQNHVNAEGKSESSNSQDGEIVLKHHVTKPVVQYVSEEIVPSRYLLQKVRPVKEFVKTIVTKNTDGSYAKPEPSY